jgi:hypothetical protein
MSMDLHVCWRGDITFESAKLKSALDTLGFEATVLHDFNSADGFWPIEIAGCKAGVEVYFNEDLEELSEFYPLLATALEGRDRGATFTMHGEAGEYGTAMALAAALASLAEVVIYEPSDDVILSPEKSVEEARYFFEQAKREGDSAEA